MKTLLTFLALIALAACATPQPRVESTLAPGVDLARHATFGWFEPLGTDEGDYTSILSSRLQSATREALEARGYRYVEENPSMWVNFSTGRRQETSNDPVVGTSVGFGSWGSHAGVSIGFGGGPSSVREAGQLVVDLVDPDARAMLWSGVVRMEDSDPSQWPAGQLRQDLLTLFADLPLAEG